MLVGELRKIHNLVVEETALKVGDFVIPGKLVIERKDCDDFVSSMTMGDKRLFRQLEEMGREDGRKVLIREGDWREGRKLGLEQTTSAVAALVSSFRQASASSGATSDVAAASRR